MHSTTISKDAPPWFRTSKALGTYFRPLPPGDRTTYFTTTSEDHLNADGSRKVVSLGPGGVEDTAVSEDTPSWFHANGVTKVPKREPHFFWDKRHDPNNPNAAKRGGISDGTPDFMRNNSNVSTMTGTMKESNRWHFKWKRPNNSLRFDKDSAVSKDAPSFFHIRGVPRARGKSGGLAFDYDSGKWNVGRVMTGDVRPRTSAVGVPRASRSAPTTLRAQTAPHPVRSAKKPISKDNIIRNLRAQIAAQKQTNRRLVTREINRIETLLQSQRARTQTP